LSLTTFARGPDVELFIDVAVAIIIHSVADLGLRFTRQPDAHSHSIVATCEKPVHGARAHTDLTGLSHLKAFVD